MDITPPKFPKTEQALKAYGDTIYVQARALGFKYTTLRDWLINGEVPRNLIRLACKRDVLLAFADDVADQPELCPDNRIDTGRVPV